MPIHEPLTRLDGGGLYRPSPMTPEKHRQYLDYLAQYEYFGRRLPKLGMDEFEASDREYHELAAKTSRDDDDEARLEELAKLLFRD